MSPLSILPPPAPADLDHVLDHAGDALRELAGERVFVTGGTGFFGRWLVESFLWANARLKLDAKLVVLSRDPSALLARAPHLAGAGALELLRGDAASFSLPSGAFFAVIHAATEPQLPSLSPSELFCRNVEATRRALALALAARASRFLFTSSGAVYGTQPPGLSHVAEDYLGAPDPTDPRTTYGQSKRASEHLCTLAHAEHGLHATLARCFAFVGPYLPLDAGFAVGNFLRDALAGGPIVIAGDGSPYRSYLYAADLAVWLWTILLRGSGGRVYNVGSEDAVSIEELAHLVQRAVAPPCAIRVLGQRDPGLAPARYVPSTARAASELGLRAPIGLASALDRTTQWLRTQQAR